MSQSYIIIFVEIEHHVTVRSPFVFGCLFDFEMMFLDIHEQTKLVVVQVVITNDCSETLHLPVKRHKPILKI
jgi:hypothetical protein